ncbi:MAG: hypothetical protein WC314_01085 [Vulcanimicrobiota bacterium]
MRNLPFKKSIPIQLLTGLLFLSLGLQTLAEGSQSQLNLPEPAIFISPDAVSFLVVKATPEDEGFRSLFDTAWKALNGARGGGNNWIYQAILGKLQGSDSNGFSTLLPAQFVRVDALPPGATEPHPTTVTTVSGWPGLQSIWYLAQGKGPNGDFPTVELGEATLMLREGHEDPTKGRILTRLDGSIASFPTVEKARSAVQRYATGESGDSNPKMRELLESLDSGKDTYGVLLNERGSALRLLRWLNKYDVTRAEEALGKDRARDVFDRILSLTWEGDLVSDDEMKMLLRFQTASPDDRQLVAAMLKDVREVLAGYGRAGKMEITGLDNELFVQFELTGYRAMLTGYIERNF